jgi:hypothetical protein
MKTTFEVGDRVRLKQPVKTMRPTKSQDRVGTVLRTYRKDKIRVQFDGVAIAYSYFIPQVELV